MQVNPELKELFESYRQAASPAAIDSTAAAILAVGQLLLERGSQPPSNGSDLTVSEASQAMNCSSETIYKLCKEGSLPHYRAGTGRGTIRIQSADVAGYKLLQRNQPLTAKRHRHLSI